VRCRSASSKGLGTRQRLGEEGNSCPYHAPAASVIKHRRMNATAPCGEDRSKSCIAARTYCSGYQGDVKLLIGQSCAQIRHSKYLQVLFTCAFFGASLIFIGVTCVCSLCDSYRVLALSSRGFFVFMHHAKYFEAAFLVLRQQSI
jgi:hypothetical protein